VRRGLWATDTHPGPAEFPSDGVTVVCVARNEADLLPSFLAHYLKLGVRHIHVVDNSSSDSTRDLASSWPRTTVWSTSASYAVAALGQLWKAAIVRRHGLGNWVLNLDADEHLVYDGMDRLDIRSLCDWLRSRRQTRLFAPLIDMYPGLATVEGHSSFLNRPADESTLERYPYFDRKELPGSANYQFQETSEGIHVKGGVRSRVIAEPSEDVFCLTKVPLALWDEETAYGNAHFPFPFSCNPHQNYGALLHFKFAGDLRTRVSQAIQENQRWKNSYESRLYDRWLGTGKPLFDEQYSVRYRGPESLISQGLLQPIEWS
jgi:glycosyltransferase involved in cell wall biosynthesis